METDGRENGRREARLGLLTGSEERSGRGTDARVQSDLVFDFTGLHRPDLADLALILTARLQAAPRDRVWVRALPYGTWMVLRALGLDHLFRVYPGPGDQLD